MDENELKKIAASISGFTSPESCFLLYSLVKGLDISEDILEIGSYKGRVTISLAQALKEKGVGKLHSIDSNFLGCRDEFLHNLKRCGVGDLVIPHFASSAVVNRGWNNPLAFIWHDTDGDYNVRALDFLLWERFLVVGGVLAFSCADMPQTQRFVQDFIVGSGRFKKVEFSGSVVYAYKSMPTPFYSCAKKIFATELSRCYYGIKKLHLVLAKGIFNLTGDEELGYKKIFRLIFKQFVSFNK